VVHITDTRAQNVFSCASAHITETVLAHDQHWEEQSSLSFKKSTTWHVNVVEYLFLLVQRYLGTVCC